MASQPAIEANGLRKRFDGADKDALDGFDLSVPRGSVCGLLGPNGAGKTTAVRILATLLRPTGGAAAVAGFDVVRQAAQVRHHIGLVGQSAALDEILSGRQNLEMFGRLFHLSTASARRRATELLTQFSLDDTGDKPVASFSGGMRRRRSGGRTRPPRGRPGPGSSLPGASAAARAASRRNRSASA